MKFPARLLLAVFVLGTAAAVRADVHFGLVEDSDDHHYYRSSGFSSFEVRFEGEIELAPDRESVTAMAPGAWLEIRNRHLFSSRMVRVSAGPDGRPQMHYWRADRTGSAEDGRDFLARNLPEAARVTAVGARGEAKRLLAAGPDRLLDAVGSLESGAAQEIYLEELVAAGGPVDPAVARRAVETAGREISSSSRLRRILVHYAAALPPDPSVTSALARACSEISSSSQSGAALAAIAEKRGVPPSAADDYAHSIGEISSSSEEATAVDRVSRHATDGPTIERLARAAESIASSSELRRALAALARHPNLPPESLARVLASGARISSSSEKATFLEDCAPLAAVSPAPLAAYLATAKTIESSSESRRALTALVRAGVSGSGLADVLRAGRRIESGSQKAELLVEAAGHPIDALAFTAWLECARTIESSSEKGRAMRTLLEKATLTTEQRKSLMDFAEREIASSSEREAVLHAALAR